MAHTHGRRDEAGKPIKADCALSAPECAERWTQFLHGHLGAPCHKVIQPSKSKRWEMNTQETCDFVRPEGPGLSFEGELARQQEPAQSA